MTLHTLVFLSSRLGDKNGRGMFVNAFKEVFFSVLNKVMHLALG